MEHMTNQELIDILKTGADEADLLRVRVADALQDRIESAKKAPKFDWKDIRTVPENKYVFVIKEGYLPRVLRKKYGGWYDAVGEGVDYSVYDPTHWDYIHPEDMPGNLENALYEYP